MMKDVSYEFKTGQELINMRKAYITHVLNHTLHYIDTIEANDKALKTTSFVSQVYQLAKEDDSESEPDEEEKQEMETYPQRTLSVDDHKDQGFTTPRVLILCPFRSIAYEIVHEIIHQVKRGSWKKVVKKKPFKQEYDPQSDQGVDDCFWIGIWLSEGKVHLLAPVAESQIIIASPAGLRLMSQTSDEEFNYDLLSSIEILVMDRSEYFIYQNMEHLEDILAHLNNVP